MVEDQEPRSKMSGHGKVVKKNSKSKDKVLKRKLFTYSEESLKEALKHIRLGEISIREASRRFRVPRATLQDRLHGRRGDAVQKTGPQPIMGVDGERRIAEWAINIAKSGFPIKKEFLIETVTKIAKEKGELHRFPNNKPGIRWYRGFLQRHPEISIREAEGINKGRALITEELIRAWFRDLNEFLKNNNLQEIVKHPQRIFNGDEAGFALCPKTGKVLAPRGWKNLYQIKTGSDKENITVLVVFNATGDVCPPLVVFPYVRPPRALVNSMPENWTLGKSETGWMRSDVFYEYICNDFNKWLNDNKIERPIILFVDGHKSHMSLPLSEFCDENGIILYALPPNTTHMLQPADVSVFKPLKGEWKKTIRNWQSRTDTANNVITKINFCSLFKETLELANMRTWIQNGFRRCGLFPLNPDEVDYTKCVKNTLEKLNRCKTITGNSKLLPQDFRSAEKVIKVIGDRLYEYGINVEVIKNEIKYLEESIHSNENVDTLVDGNAENNFVGANVDTNSGDENVNRNGLEVGQTIYVDDIHALDVADVAVINSSNDFSPVLQFIDLASNIVPNTTEREILDNDADAPENERDKTAVLNELPSVILPDAIPEREILDYVDLKNERDMTAILNESPSVILRNTDATSEKKILDSNALDNDGDITAILNEPPSVILPAADAENERDMAAILSKSPPAVLPDAVAIRSTSHKSPETETSDNEMKVLHEVVIRPPFTEEHTVRDEMHQTPEKNVPDHETSNQIVDISSESPTTPFSKHLLFPAVTRSQQNFDKKERLPSAISSKEWRTFYEKKDSAKRKKVEAVRKRKELKELNQNIPKKPKPKNVGNKKKSKFELNYYTAKVRIKCSLCEDELISEAEEDSEKNIGCDHCSRWYHLRCTEFGEHAYEDVASKDYICDICK